MMLCTRAGSSIMQQMDDTCPSIGVLFVCLAAWRATGHDFPEKTGFLEKLINFLEKSLVFDKIEQLPFSSPKFEN
jgi:hypothetical protein